MTTDTNQNTEDMLGRLEQLSTPAVADTKHGGVGVLHPTIEPIHDRCAFAGIARTVAIDPSAIWAPVQTLDSASSGEVIVVDVGDCVDEAVWGELLSQYAVANGVVGVVTNGAVRDISSVRDTGFPAFARASTPSGPSGSEEVGTNEPVTVGEVLIHPGDFLLGDESGVVVIDSEAIEKVLIEAETIAETEREVERLIGESDSLEGAFETAGM